MSNGPSEEQRRVIESWGQGMAVTAGAGSGKTTTLVAKCAALLERNPEARFAAVSFTERSASDLREKLSRKFPLTGHWVTTIHGLCGTILREYPREAGFDGEETMLSEAEAQLLWERAVDALWSDELPEEIQKPFDRLLERESRDQLRKLLRRTRELNSFGVLAHLGGDGDSGALGEVARFVLERFDRLKRRRGGLDFNDLEAGADRALGHSHVREAYRKRFDLIMVDEFQDTNPVQARILLRMAREDLSNLCVVGDPKQSIYRFRDADIAVFGEFCAKMPLRLSLTWNFRSRPGIIEFANRVCEPAFEASGMKYEALVPKRERAGEAVRRLDVEEPAQFAAWVQAEVASGAKLEDMALLLRKIRGNEKWLKALTSRGIPIAVGSGGLFWEDPRVRELVAFLKWWDNPSNALSGGIFLRAPWIGIEDTKLDEWVRQDRTWRKPFFASDHPVAQALAPWREKIARPGELLSALVVSDAVEAELGAAFLGLWHRCEELSSRGLDSRSVVAELAEALQESRRERDVPPPKNRGQLQVLTLHGSKGLEFPRVILVDFGPKWRGGEAPLLFWDRDQGAYLAGRTSDGDRDRDNEVEEDWRALEKEKNLAESKRVLYVALTRAREELLLVCPKLPEKAPPKKAPKETDPFREDFWRAWIDLSSQGLPRAQLREAVSVPANIGSAALVPRPRPAKRAPVATRRPRHSVTEWNLLSRCPRAYEWSYIRPVAARSAFAPEFGYGLATGELGQKELGTRVHSCLESADLEELGASLRALEEEVGSHRLKAEPFLEWARKSEWMRPAEPALSRDVRTELAFELPVGDEVLVGSMDRVVMEPGRSVVVDFKITREKKDKQALLEAYRMQMEIYAHALKRLEPALASQKVEGVLINLSEGSVEVVPVPLQEIALEPFVQKSARILAGEAGEPTPGTLCRVCPFHDRCDSGRQFLGASN